MKNNIEYFMNLPYRLEIIPDPEEHCYAIRFPDLPGCITVGETAEAAIKNAEDAKREWILSMMEDGMDIPLPTYPKIQKSAGA